MPLLSPSPPMINYPSIDFSFLSPFSNISGNPPHAPVLSFQNLPDVLIHAIPALALLMLIFSSLIFTESISMSKYPRYKEYQERVSMFGLCTLGKGLWLKWAGRKEEVEMLIWGDSKELNKTE